MRFSGTITALITPFRNGSVDVEGLRHNVFFQLEEGVDGLLVLGSTGEMLSLSAKEKATVIETVIQEVDGKIPVIVNTGAASTSDVLQQTKNAKKMGASAALIAPPFYVRPNEEGIYRHYCTVADEGGLPVLLYNIPKRTGVSLTLPIVSDLVNHPQIVGMKDSSGDLSFISHLLFEQSDKNWSLLSGEDMLTLPILALGGDGVISVASNVIPAKVCQLVSALQDGQVHIARQLHSSLMPLFSALTLETNPIPIKSAMQLAGMAAGDVRMPLMPLHESQKESLKQALSQTVHA